jgi:hypothetical protein
MSFFYTNDGVLLDPQQPQEPGKYGEIKVGEPLAIRLMGAYLCGMSDGIFIDPFKSSYPVLIHSSVIIGGGPGVEQIHYYSRGEKNGTFLPLADVCYNDIVYSTKSWVGEEVFLELGVYEVDKIEEEWIVAINTIAKVTGAVFLAYATYIWGAAALVKLAIAANNKFNPNDKVITRTVRLEPAQSSPYRKKLMSGRYVVFTEGPTSEAINPKDWNLNAKNQLVATSGPQLLRDQPYLVMEVNPKLPAGREEFQASQELAHFLQMIKGDKRGPRPADYTAIVKSAAEGLAMCRNLDTVRSLYEKGDSRSAEETEKLKALLKNIETVDFAFITEIKKEILGK